MFSIKQKLKSMLQDQQQQHIQRLMLQYKFSELRLVVNLFGAAEVIKLFIFLYLYLPEQPFVRARNWHLFLT